MMKIIGKDSKSDEERTLKKSKTVKKSDKEKKRSQQPKKKARSNNANKMFFLH